MISLALSVLDAVLAIGITSLPGFIAGAFGIIDQVFLRSLSRFKINCLTPCLIFATFGSRLTYERLSSVWLLVLWSALQLCVGFVASRALLRAHITATWTSQGFAALDPLLRLGMCFQNVSAFCLPMVQTLCQKEGLFEGHAEHCVDDGTLMVFGYKFPWEVGMWTRGYNTMSTLSGTKTSDRDASVTVTLESAALSKCKEKQPLSLSQFLTLSSWLQGLLPLARDFVNPIFVAMVLGMLVGLLPPLRGLFFSPGAPLSPIGVGLKRIGAIVPVLALQVLSGTLGLTARQLWHDRQKDAGSSVGDSSALLRSRASWLFMIVFGKLVLLPAIAFCMFFLLHHLQRSPKVVLETKDQFVGGDSNFEIFSDIGQLMFPKDRLLRTVLVLEWSAPSAMSLIALCHRFSMEASITQIVAVAYLVMYLGTTIATTCWVTLGLAVF